MADNLRRSSLSYLRNAQTKDGGWGPKADTPTIIDTSLAVLALSMLDTDPRMARSTYRPEELKEAIARGKQYLVSKQQPDGSWQGGGSVPWALLALLS